METEKAISKGRRWASYVLQTLIVLMLLLGGINNLLQTEEAVQGAMEMGFARESVVFLGIILLVSTILYIIPRTSILGAILLTGWLGGAVVAHIIHKDEVFFILFPIVFGILMWFSLWLRDRRLQQMLKS